MKILIESFNQYASTILYTVLMGVISYVGIKLKNLVEEYTNEKITKEVVKTVCGGVEQLYGSLSGREKLEKTIENSKQILEEKGIRYTDLELRMYIENSVGCLKRKEEIQ